MVGLSLKYLLTIHREGATRGAGRSVDNAHQGWVGTLTEVIQVLRPRADGFEYPQTTIPSIGGQFRHNKPSSTKPLLHFLIK